MKKKIIILAAACTVILSAAFSTDLTSAHFVKRADDPGKVTVTANSVDAQVALTLDNYGIPSDTLTGKSSVTVRNTGKTDIVYKLSLNVDADTAKLIVPNGLTLWEKDMAEPLNLDNPGPETYVYYGVLVYNGEETFDLGLTFKGVELIDGNDYQGKPITLTPTIEACQATPAAVLDVFGKAYDKEGGVVK